jgi:uncharacterized protein YbjT (DUF2867 family)
VILLTGATGYIGGRLLAALERNGHCVRCSARRSEFLNPHVAPLTQVAGMLRGIAARAENAIV